MPSAVSEAVIRPVAVLLCSNAVKPRPVAKAVKRLPSALPERAQHAAEDHMQAPQQQRDAAHQVKKYDASHHRDPAFWNTTTVNRPARRLVPAFQTRAATSIFSSSLDQNSDA
jgi:hypothetical protein